MNYKFLIYISYSYAIPIGIPLEKEILQRGYTVKWFSDLEEGKITLKDNKNLLNHIKEVITYKPDIVLTITDNVADFITGIKVQVFHGFFTQKRPSKSNMKFAHFRIRGFFDLYCTQGPSTTETFEILAKKHQYFEAIQTGWSKVDPLFPIVKRDKEVVPTIMIGSTFTPRLSLAYDNTVFNEIKRLTENEMFNFIMVLHPKIPQNIINKWKSLDSDRFRFYNTTNLVPLFKKADIMFSDTTSAIQEFLLQKKPVVTFKHTFKHNYLIGIENANEIENALNYALTYPKDIIKNIEKFIQELHPYFDGRSSKRIIDATISFLIKNKGHLKHKPLNLIRKYKVRKQLGYFTLKSYNKPFSRPPRLLKKLTALVITHNEKENINDLIENLGFADEIIVVDSFSSDGTVEAIKKHNNVKLIQYKFINFSNQRNFALKQATHDWVLFIDADERISNDLKDEIIDALQEKNKIVAYSFYRKFYFKKAIIKFSGYQTDNVFRLFNKNHVSYNDNKLVHETLDVDGETKVFTNKLNHYSYKSDELFRKKLIKYAKLRAQELYSKKLKPNFYHFYVKPVYRFLYQFIIRFGFLDGKIGYKISRLNAFEVQQRYVELRKLYSKK